MEKKKKDFDILAENCKELVEYLKKEDFFDYKGSFIFFYEKGKEFSIVEFKDKFVIVQRVGKCDYKKCKNACCKFCSALYVKDYSRGFFDGKDSFGKDILKRKCNNLQKNGLCKLWRKKSSKNSIKNKGFPIACKQFPHVGDGIYWEVADVCSYKFRIVYTIKKVGEKIRKEMIKGFMEQFEWE